MTLYYIHQTNCLVPDYVLGWIVLCLAYDSITFECYATISARVTHTKASEPHRIALL